MIKELALEFLQQVVKGNIDYAYETYIDTTKFKHHNAYFKEDLESLKNGMKESHESHPNKEFLIHQVIVDSDKVATHSFLRQSHESPGMQVVHIFRFENNKIVEMWDVVHILPDESPNKLGPF